MNPAVTRSALTALTGAALLLTPAVAFAQDADAPLTVAVDATVCGQATITYTSTNTLPYSGDYRVGDEPGFRDAVTDLEVKEGPFAGQLFGPRFHPVPVPAGATVPVLVELGEDQGGGQVEVAAWVNRGPEQKAHAATVTVVVDTDCEPPVTTPPATPDEDVPALPALDEFNCGDFPLPDSRTAQDVLDADPADPNVLDRDGDGTACDLDGLDGGGFDGGGFDQVGDVPVGGVATGTR
ncbi:MAG: hypothetical protein L0H84_20765 [Pseudonocardia sp.]|nr:hypothetical protein [Pseudonocardia sp.]